MARWQEVMAFFEARGYAPLVTFGVPGGPRMNVTIQLEHPAMVCSGGQWSPKPPWPGESDHGPLATVPSVPAEDDADDDDFCGLFCFEPLDLVPFKDDVEPNNDACMVFCQPKAPALPIGAQSSFQGPCIKTVQVSAGLHGVTIGVPGQDPIVLDLGFQRDPDDIKITVDPMQGTAYATWITEEIGPESEEYLRALCEIHHRVTREPMPLTVDMAQLSGSGCAALTDDQARRLWIWRLALAVYTDREQLFLAAPTLHLLDATDFHLLLDWHYARWQARQALPAGAAAGAMPRDVVPPLWYQDRMVVTYPAEPAAPTGAIGVRFGVVPPPTAPGLGADTMVCAYASYGAPWTPADDSDRVAQPGSQWLWATAPAEVVTATMGRSGFGPADASYSWHTGSLWDTDPLENLVEAVVALQRYVARAGGFDPDGAQDDDGVWPPAPDKAATVASVVKLDDGKGPPALRSALALRTRAALLYITELAQRRAAGLSGGMPSAAALDHAPTCVDAAESPMIGTPTFQAFAATLAGSASPEMARMQLLLALLRTLNVPARLEIRPRPDHHEIKLVAPMLMGAGGPQVVPELQIVRSTEPFRVVSGPQIALPTLGRVVTDWTVLSDTQLPYASVRDPLELTVETGFAGLDRGLADAVAQGGLGLGSMLAQATAGPWAQARLGLTRSLALGLLRFGGVRQQWMLGKIKASWQGWAEAQPAPGPATTGMMTRSWQHGLFEARATQEVSGNWCLLEPLVVVGAKSDAWRTWPSYRYAKGEGASMEWILSMTWPDYADASKAWWAWAKAKAEKDKKDPPSGRIVGSGGIAWLETDATILSAIDSFSQRIQ